MSITFWNYHNLLVSLWQTVHLEALPAVLVNVLILAPFLQKLCESRVLAWKQMNAGVSLRHDMTIKVSLRESMQASYYNTLSIISLIHVYSEIKSMKYMLY